jgi:hypothetical protein
MERMTRLTKKLQTRESIGNYHNAGARVIRIPGLALALRALDDFRPRQLAVPRVHVDGGQWRCARTSRARDGEVGRFLVELDLGHESRLHLQG